MLLWLDRVDGEFFQEVIDVIIVDFNVGDKHCIAAVVVYNFFTILTHQWSQHITKFSLLHPNNSMVTTTVHNTYIHREEYYPTL